MLPGDLQRICSLLRRYMAGEESRLDLTTLLNLITGICRRSILHRRWIEQVARSEDTTFTTMVMSLAATFMGGQNSPGALRLSLRDHAEESNEQLFLYFENLTGRLMYHALYRRCAELNPAPRKMRHHLGQIVRNDSSVTCYYEGKKPAWLALAGQSDLREERLPWSDAELLYLLYQLVRDAKGRRELLLALLKRVSEQMDRRAFIEFAQVVTLFHLLEKEQAEGNIRDALGRKEDTPLDKLARVEAAEIVKKECADELERLQNIGKLNGYLGAYGSALCLLLDDLADYCDREKHWKYLNQFLPEVNERTYRRDHRRFEELAHFVKRRFAEILGKME